MPIKKKPAEDMEPYILPGKLLRKIQKQKKEQKKERRLYPTSKK